MAFTYDLATAVGKVRAVLPDAVQATAVFTDEEITLYLSLSGQSIFATCALAYETLARDRTRGLKKGSELDVTREYYTSQELLAMAAAARNAGLSGSLQTGSITQGGDGLDEYRPLWRTMFDLTLE